MRHMRNTFIIYLFFLIFLCEVTGSRGIIAPAYAQKKTGSASEEEMPPELVMRYEKHKQAIEIARQGDLKVALKMMKELYDESSDDARIVADYIAILSWNDNFASAAELYELHFDEIKHLSYVKPEVARCYRLLGRNDDAISLYEEYLTENPDDIDANASLAYTYIHSNMYQEAKDLIETGLSKQSRMKRWLSLAALLQAHQGHWNDFFSNVKNLRQSTSEDEREKREIESELTEGFSLAYDAAIRKARLGDYNTSAQMMAQLKECGYGTDSMSIDAIVINVWKGDFAAAINGYENLPSNVDRPLYLLKAIARAYEQTGQTDKLEAVYRKIFEMTPEDIDIRIASLGKADTYDETERMIDKLLAGDPNNLDFKLRKSEVLLLQGKYDEFIKSLSDSALSRNYGKTKTFLSSIMPLMSDEDWLEIHLAMLERDVKIPFTYPELAVLLERLKNHATDADDYNLFKYELLKSFDSYPLDLRLDLADICLKFDDIESARDLYESIIKEEPDNLRLRLGLAKIESSAENYENAMVMVEEVLKRDPGNTEALFLKGYIYEETGDYVRAIDVYQAIRANNKADLASLSLEIRALMELGANSVAMDKLDGMGGNADRVLVERARGNMAMQNIHWEEPARAVQGLQREIEYYEDIAEAQDRMYEPPKFIKTVTPSGNVEYSFPPEDTDTQHYYRAKWDKILAMRQNQDMEEIVKQYEEYVNDGVELPFWIREAAGDAYLYLEQPKKALELYESVLAEQPENHNTRMAIYHTLVELSRFVEAKKVIDELDQETPTRVYDRGLMRYNWKKAEIIYAKAWWYMYHDRYTDAENYLKEAMSSSPFNTNLRTAMAHVYFWRGWPKKALEEIEIARTLSDDNISTENGYCLILNDNIKKKEAREHLEPLLEKYPKQKHLQRTKRAFDIEEMTTLQIDSYYSYDMPGNDEWSISARLERPVGYHHTLFGEILRRETINADAENVLDKLYLGDVWQPDNIWKFTGAISYDFDDFDDFGALAEASITPDDYWTFDIGYENKVTDIPLRSRANGVEADQYSLAATYRMSEMFDTSFSFAFKDFTDNNHNLSYIWTTNSYYIIYPNWRYGMGTQYYYSTNSKQDVDYYSPGHIHSVYFVPMIEHTWFRRYEQAFVDRFYVGLGRQWQKNYTGKPVGYITYEQDVRISDTLILLIGATQSLRNYDGDYVDNFTIYSTIINKF
ncbi:MAG: tetratricopeptide repeat protein [Candidatus Omnitrophica bacterium]|nr:tetratricopeptide repeat protein [Candidatus Omnitrophota bacterium]